MASQDVVGKIFGIFFPIMAFVASGFEHCVANMYFIPMGILLKGDAAMADAVTALGAKADLLNWGGFFINNLIPVTLGNIVGGAVFVGLAYFMVYVKQMNTCKG
jgi:formate/nitrite transporter FocA (FNT family)